MEVKPSVSAIVNQSLTSGLFEYITQLIIVVAVLALLVMLVIFLFKIFFRQAKKQ